MPIVLGRYELIGILGKGSMGEVHAARPIDDPANTVVVKILRQDLADTPRAQEFFQRETQYTAKLCHPFIVRLLDSGIDEQFGPCLVLELVPGHTLQHVLDIDRMMVPVRVARLAGCLCHALAAAHQRGIFHRDLKPANLMLVNIGTPDEYLKIMDFGLSQISAKPHLSKERLSGHDIVLAQGTPAYISPEQLRGDDVDGRADIYSVGVIMYEMLTGVHPFPSDDMQVVMHAHLHERPPRFANWKVHHVPPAMEAVVMQCLSKYAPERPGSARELAIAISQAMKFDIWAAMTPPEEIAAEAELPIAEELPPEPKPSDPLHVIRRTEAWMPDRIAVLKLGGFLKDQQGDLLHTEPGLLKARFYINEPAKGFLGRLFHAITRSSIDLDVLLDRPNPNENRLVLTLEFRPTRGTSPTNTLNYFHQCDYLFDEIRKYLM